MAISKTTDQLFRETVFPSMSARQVRPITRNLLKERECLIVYKPPDADYNTADALEWFETYADASNKSPQKWIDEPFISALERLPGKWRLVTVRTENERGEDPGIYLLLREGWATSLLESEARFSQVQGAYATGALTFTRTWYNIDPTLTASLAATLKATATVTDPKLEGKAQSGTFASSGVIGQVMSEDGAGMISQTLTQITALSGATTALKLTNLAARRYIKTHDNEILAPFNIETGESDTQAWIFSNMNPDDETLCMTTFTDAALVTKFDSDATYSDRHWKLEDNGTATFIIVLKDVAFNAWSGNDKDSYNTVNYANSGRDGERRTKTWELIAIADRTTAQTYLNNDSNADSGYHVLSVQVSNHRDGSCDLVQVSIKKVQETASSDNNLQGQKIISPHGFHKGELDTKESIYSNYSAAEIQTLTDATPSGYTLVSKTPDIQGDGLYRCVFRYEKVTLREWGKNFAGEAYTTHDSISYDNAGTANERERITKTWTNIRIADILTAVTALRTGSTGYAPESGYVITTVTPRGGEDGSFSISQTQKKQVTGIDVEGSKLIDPHALQEGLLDTTTTRYEHFTESDIDNASLGNPANKVPGTDAGVISNDKQGPDGDGLFSRIIVEETVTWVTWAGSNTPDITETLNPGTERQGYRKTWYGIRNDDLAAALEDLKDGTVAAESGYIVTDCRVRPGPMGSITLTQDQINQINYVDTTSTSLINPHALQEGKISRTRTIYENFLEGTLPIPSNKVPGTDSGVISNEVEGPDANGFFSRIIIEETTTWSSWTAVASSPDTTEYDNQNTKKERKIRTWLAVRQSSKTAADSALVSPESGYTVASIRIGDNRNGSLRFTQTQKIKTKGSNGDELQADGQVIVQPHNFKSGTIDKILIINEDLAATSDAYTTLSGTGYTKVREHEDLQGNGLWTVYHFYEKVTWNDFTASVSGNDLIRERYPEGEKDSSYPVKIREKTWLNVKIADKSTAESWLWANADSNYRVDDVISRNNGDGSMDFVQVTSYVNTSYSDTWSLAGGTYFVRTWSGSGTARTLLSATRYDRIWDYERKYFTSESDAWSWIEPSLTGESTYGGSGVSKITPNAFRAIKKTKGTDRISVGW